GVPFEERVYGGRTWFVLSSHYANEFLTKKDYVENWDIEVNEEFGVFQMSQWARELPLLGLRPRILHSYPNPWIVANRYEGRVLLCADLGDRPGPTIPWMDNTSVLVADKF